MKFDVAVATMSGTLMKMYITGTLMGPPPMPSSPDSAPATSDAPSPRGYLFGSYGGITVSPFSAGDESSSVFTLPPLLRIVMALYRRNPANNPSSALRLK